MSNVINGWKIDKTNRAGHAQYWIIHNTETVGRAIKQGREWEAMDKLGKQGIFAEDGGAEVKAKTLDELITALAKPKDKRNETRKRNYKAAGVVRHATSLWVLKDDKTELAEAIKEAYKPFHKRYRKKIEEITS